MKSATELFQRPQDHEALKLIQEYENKNRTTIPI
jgi:hypothetical protein